MFEIEGWQVEGDPGEGRGEPIDQVVGGAGNCGYKEEWEKTSERRILVNEKRLEETSMKRPKTKKKC